MKMRTQSHFLRIHRKAIRGTRISLWAKFLNLRIPGSCTTRKSIPYLLFSLKKSWTGTIWLPRVCSHQYLTCQSIQWTPSSSIFSTRSLTRWPNTTFLFSKRFSPRITIAFAPWSPTFWKFRTQFTDLERLLVILKSCMVLLTKSSTTSKKWLMNSKSAPKPIFLNTPIREF